MKKIILNFIFLSFFCTSILAQNIPQGMSYQAVARDADGQLLSDININIRIALISNIERRGVAYSEIHNVKTNKFGLFNFTIGQGESLTGDFEEIPWESEEIWLEVALDENASDDFKIMNTTKLLTVPYAFHAGSANELVPINPNGDGRVPWWGQPWWNIEGLEKTNPDKHFVGNIDSVDLVFRTNNLERLRIKANGEIVMPGDVEIGGSLQVNGDSTIVQNLYVKGQEAVIDNFLFVGDDADFGDNITVVNNITAGGDGTFQNIHALNNGTIDNVLAVAGPSFLNGNLNVAGNTTLNSTLNVNGSGSYIANFNNSTNANGISIKVANSTPGVSNNFVTLRNSSGGVVGRIEGQTAAELATSFEFIWHNSMEALHTSFQTAIVIADLVGIDDADAAVVGGLELATAIAEWAEWNISLFANIGVAFESGSGDYAEWLEKESPLEVFSYGDIVGVKGGKISKTMTDADHFMVVSLSPIILGNMPPENRIEDYEKIAFMGQVPVKVRGVVNIGDYIIPSNLADGFGIAVSPKNITIEQYKKIVGVAWTGSDGKQAFSMINTAVGINSNDASDKLAEIQSEMNDLKSGMNNIISYLQKTDPNFNAEQFVIPSQLATEVEGQQGTQLKSTDQLSQANSWNEKRIAISNFIQKNPEFFKNVLTDAKEILDAEGIDYKRYEQTNRLLNDETYLVSLLMENTKD